MIGGERGLQMSALAHQPPRGGRIVPEIGIFGQQIALGPLSLPFTLLWLLGAINALNLLDGLDGLAGGLSAISAGTLMVLETELSTYFCTTACMRT